MITPETRLALAVASLHEDRYGRGQRFRRCRPRLVGSLLVVVALTCLAGCTRASQDAGGDGSSAQPIALDFVGRSTCEGCHPAEVQAYHGSHHDLAMAEADETTVLGDFSDTELVVGRHTVRFSKASSDDHRDGAVYRVRISSKGAAATEMTIRHSFGVEPLQQYLVRLPNGALQALPFAWDARSEEEGGQRWYSIHDEAALDEEDPLHWSGPYQNWDFMCAECHSTAVEKRYSPEEHSFATRWREIDVSCEACHGPASRHVAEMQRESTQGALASRGFPVALGDRDGGIWRFEKAAATASRSPLRDPTLQVDTCGRCHARRASQAPHRHGSPLLDSHRPALLEAGLYHVDGQILDEVYVYGSFLQSQMYRNGVVCSDCHDPHSLALRMAPLASDTAPVEPAAAVTTVRETDAVCVRCHRAASYAMDEHHHHPAASDGARCVSCHMPTETYMGVDSRHDHSLRIPRPALSEELGTPDACSSCHAGQHVDTQAWAAAAVATWFPNGRQNEPHFGRALKAARTASRGADRALLDAFNDARTPNIARATLVAEMAPYLTLDHLGAVELAVRSSDPLLRLGALRALAGADPETQSRLAGPRLNDPVHAVRIDAAQLLANLPPGVLPVDVETARASALAEAMAAARLHQDSPSGLVQLGLLHSAGGNPTAAEAAYGRALDLDPHHVAARLDLADLLRATGRETQAAATLTQGIARSERLGARTTHSDAEAIRTSRASLEHSLGLSLVRQGRTGEALHHLRTASRLAPHESRYGYVLGVALHDSGDIESGLEVLRSQLERRPADRQLLAALFAYSEQRSDLAAALDYGQRLIAEGITDPGLSSRLVELETALAPP